MSRLIEVSSQFNLDFDDAYQYVAAELRGLVIVSFDGDFDRTLLGRKTPAQVLGMNA
jgi:predicted nucleic acid-binding protein